MKIKLDYNISEPSKIGNLAIFGVSSSTNRTEEYLCLPEALEKNLVEIREISKEGSVNDLSLHNHSSKSLLCSLEEVKISGFDKILSRTSSLL